MDIERFLESNVFQVSTRHHWTNNNHIADHCSSRDDDQILEFDAIKVGIDIALSIMALYCYILKRLYSIEYLGVDYFNWKLVKKASSKPESKSIGSPDIVSSYVPLSVSTNIVLV